MITNENCGLSPQATCLLVNLFTRQLTQGVSRISLPSLRGRGRGRGQLGPVVLLVLLVLLVVFSFLQQALSKYRVLNILLVFEYEAGNDGTQ